MRIIKTIINIYVLSIFVISCAPKSKKAYTTINGNFEIYNNRNITLSKVENGKQTIVATSKLNKNNQYGFSITPEKEGFYTIGSKLIELPIYVKGNQIFEINFTPDGGFSLPIIPDEENEILFNWHKAKDTLQTFNFSPGNTITYETFFPFYEEYIPVLKKFHGNVTSKNEYFNKLMHRYIDLNIENEALTFIFTPRVKHPTSKQMAPFYEYFMKGDNFKSSIILDIPEGINTLRQHLLFKLMYSKDKIDSSKKRNFANIAMEFIENDTLRGFYVLENLHRFKTYNDRYLNFITPRRKDIALSDYVLNKVKEYETSIKTIKIGDQGCNFTFKDINGKDVSFTDFKGKYVYLDVWATWCAPCKKEIPALKKLEIELHDKNIVFISISMDKPKDKAEWETFVKEKELTGVQLFSENAFETKIAKEYIINSIPRFLLFDTEGKIIETDAMRPSNPDLKRQLLKLLK